MKATIYQIDSAGQVMMFSTGLMDEYDMECSFARTEVLHVDPVVSDNFVPNILIKEDQDM